MSSLYVRDEIAAFLAAEIPGEKYIDLTSEFYEVNDLLTEYGVNPGEDWVGLQFVGSEEVPVDILSTNTSGTYREVGVLYIHVVALAKLGVGRDILIRAETIRNKLRGQRIAGNILIEGVAPATFGEGATLSFEGGYTAALVAVTYQRDLVLT